MGASGCFGEQCRLIGPIADLAAADADEWGQAINVNLKGVYHGIRAALPVMRAQGGGTILTVGSGATHAPQEGWSAYCSSKAGAWMLTQALDHGNGPVVTACLSFG